MSFSQLIDKIIPDGTKIDELSKEYLDDSEDKDIESLYVLSIFGILVPFLSPLIYYSVKRRKEAALALIIVLAAVIFSVLSMSIWWGFLTATLISIVNFVLLGTWIRGIYLFITEFLPMKKIREEDLQKQKQKDFQDIVYDPNKNKE